MAAKITFLQQENCPNINTRIKTPILPRIMEIRKFLEMLGINMEQGLELTWTMGLFTELKLDIQETLMIQIRFLVRGRVLAQALHLA